MSEFVLPDLGEGLVEAEIVEWHVGVGDRVVGGQPLVSVETDKSVVEVPAPYAGTIAACHGEPGDLVAVGAPLVRFAEGPATDAGSVVGRVPDHGGAAGSAGSGGSAGSASSAGASAGGGAGTGAHVVGRASPAVRALATRLGVELAGVAGTGPGGAVTSADVEAAAAAAGGGIPVEPLRGVRRAMAANMARAHREVVPATVHEVADVGAWAPGTDPTLRLLRAIGAAAVAEPALNAEFLGMDRGRRLHDTVDVGVAVETDDGLFVPVLRDVARRDAADLRAGLDALRADVANRSIPPDELVGATIALSNYGMHGGLHAELVVVSPQVAIVGAGRLHDAVLAVDGVATVRPVLPISLSFDHRVVTGVEATRFLAALLADLQASD